MIAVGALFSVTGTELCMHGCWLDDLVDGLLPASLENASGGIPLIVIGLALVVHTLCARR